MQDLTPRASPPVLTSDLDYWDVRLKGGGMITLRAHGVVERQGHYCFVALMAGTPAYEYELARLPMSDVESYEGGWPAPRELRGSTIEGEQS